MTKKGFVDTKLRGKFTISASAAQLLMRIALFRQQADAPAE